MVACCRSTSSTPPPLARRAPTAVLTSTAATTRAVSTSKGIDTRVASSVTPQIAMRRITRSAPPSRRPAASCGQRPRALAAQSRRLRRHSQYRRLRAYGLWCAGIWLEGSFVWRTLRRGSGCRNPGADTAAASAKRRPSASFAGPTHSRPEHARSPVRWLGVLACGLAASRTPIRGWRREMKACAATSSCSPMPGSCADP